jgi:multicomponent Na+:H+ antiporter subunit G
MFIGLFGVFRFKDFYSKLLASSKIDTVAVVTMIFGLVIRSGFTWFSLKCLLILVFFVFINPIISTKIANSYRRDNLNKRGQ